MSRLSIIAAALLVTAGVRADTLFDYSRLQELPETHTLDLASCLKDAGALALPTAPALGAPLRVDRGARPGAALLWLGVAQVLRTPGEPAESWAYFAVFAADGGAASSCRSIGTLDDVLALGPSGTWIDALRPLPILKLTVSGRSGCGASTREIAVGQLRTTDTVELLAHVTSSAVRGGCEDELTEQLAREELQKQKQQEATVRRALAAFRQGRPREAERLWREIAADSVEGLNNLGFLYERQGRHEEAERALLQTIARQPGRAVAYLNLAELYWKLGDRALARPVYAEYVARMEKQGLGAKVANRGRERSGKR
ncbi:MAG: tetratricopeptide repeat protein [Myxococcales bacterium]